MLAGKVLAESAMRQDKRVTWLPAYGAEVRGGAAYCMVVISDEEIGSPFIEKADTLIVMNEPSLRKFQARVQTGGLAIINSSLAEANACRLRRTLKHPFTEIAVELGNIKVANMVALGCYLGVRKNISPETVIAVMRDYAPKDKPEVFAANRAALLKGKELS